MVRAVPDIDRAMDKGDRCEQLYRTYADQVFAYARRRSDDQTADEVVAEVFLVAWRRLDVVPSDALPWLLGVARKALANQRRASARAAALNNRIGETVDTADRNAGGDHLILAALAALDPGERELLLLLAWEGLNHAEIAAVLAISRAAVASRLYRARRHLAQVLADHDEPALSRRRGSR